MLPERNPEKQKLTLDQVQAVITKRYNMPLAIIQTYTRKREIVYVRQIAMYASCYFTKASHKSIGEFYGTPSNPYDHTTVIHSIQAVLDLCDSNKDYKQDIEALGIFLLREYAFSLKQQDINSLENLTSVEILFLERADIKECIKEKRITHLSTMLEGTSLNLPITLLYHKKIKLRTFIDALEKVNHQLGFSMYILWQCYPGRMEDMLPEELYNTEDSVKHWVGFYKEMKEAYSAKKYFSIKEEQSVCA